MSVENESIAEKPASDELCRLCANTDKQLIPIFQGEGIEHNISEQIKKYLPIITVTKMDKLPLQICYQCTSTLIAWHNFFEQCRVADNRLREILSVNEKLIQDDESYHDYHDDFRDDFEDQSAVCDNVPVKATSAESTINDSQPMDTSDNNTTDASKNVNKETSENLSDSRCLRTTVEIIKLEDVCANMLGTRSGRLGPSRSCKIVTRSQGQISDAAIVPIDHKVVEMNCPFSICACIWSSYNADDCAQCSSYNKFVCGFCPMVFLHAHLRNRHVRSSHQDHLLDHCMNWLYENSLKSRCIENVADGDEISLDEADNLAEFQCSECAVTFIDKGTLIRHLRSHDRLKRITRNRDVFRCVHCTVAFTSKTALIAHLQFAHTNVVEGDCAVTESTESEGVLCDRVPTPAGASDRNADYYTCDICGHIFLRLHSFTRHQNLHSADRYRCSKCKQSFASEKMLALHEERRHKEQPKNMFVLDGRKYLKCDQCSFVCRNERNKLEEHMRVHTGEKPFTCESCGKQFRTRSLLGVHQRFVHDGIKEYPCDLCGRYFSNRRYTEEHRRIHTGEKPLVCDLCGKCFRQSSSLNKHIEHHMGIKRHACHLCNKRFNNTHHLKIHVKRHMGVATHVCAQCGKAFVDQYQLKNHYVVHSEERPFVCKECGAGFKLRKHLKQHGRTHRFVN